MKKRMFAVLMTAALTLGLATPAFAAGVKRPVLTSVAVGEGVLNEDETEYEYPVTVVAEGSDAELEHITVRFENEANDNTANLVLRAADQTAENTYEGVLSVSAYAQEGTYTLSKVTLQETDGDYRYYYRSKDLPSDPGDDKKALPNAVSLKLNSGVSAEDKTAPVLDGCAVTKTSVLKETAVELHAQVTETGSGIDSVKARFVGDNGRAISVTLTLAEGEYVGYLSPSQLKYEGTYVLQRLIMKDKAGNRSVATDRGDVRFTVTAEPDAPTPITEESGEQVS